MARAGRYRLHQKWMIRHVASGIWVAAQRFIVIPICIFVLNFTHPSPDDISPILQREVFGGSAMAAMIVCVCIAEYVIRRSSSKSAPTRSTSTSGTAKKEY